LTDAIADIDSGSAGRRRGRARMCALTRSVRPDTYLIRFVAGPDGSVVPDLKARLPGRGIWLGADRATVTQALGKNVFPRGLKQPVRPAEDLADKVANLLRQAALGRLGLARRARAAVAGFAKVEAAIGRDELAALLAASDAAPDGERKIGQAMRRRFGDALPIPVIRLFDSAELGLAMGRPDVIHAAVLQGPSGRSFVEAAIRLQRYESAGDGRMVEKAVDPQEIVG
jgi:uncharacterized protein